MTIRFLKEFWKKTTCQKCKAAPAEGRKTCPEHLIYARLRFRFWSAARAKLGLCLSCDRRGYQGECRCLLHKGRNQQACRIWNRLNADWLAFRVAFEKSFLKLEGFCRVCQRRQSAAGRVTCRLCNARQREHNDRYRERLAAA